MRTSGKGFTLTELMVSIAVVAILASLAYPSYESYIRKADRSEAKVTLVDWSNRQEIWRADHPDYTADITPTNTESYSYTMVSTATSYTLTATGLARQKRDKEAGVACATLTLDQAGNTGPKGHEKCWN